jgi:hypothetical protein
MNIRKKLADCDRDEVLERLHRSADRNAAKQEQIEALEKKIVNERSGRRQANRRADEAVKAMKEARAEVLELAALVEKRLLEIDHKEEALHLELSRLNAQF